MRRGFSLIETIIVVAIVAIVAGVAVPRYVSSLNRYHAKGSAQAIASLVLEAQARARATSSNVSLKVYSTAKIGQLDASGAVLRQIAVDSDAFHSKIHQYILGGDSVIVFDGFGRPDSAGLIQVSSGSAGYKVVIDTQGRVSVLLASALVEVDADDITGEMPGDSGEINVELGPLDISLGGGAGVQLN